MAAWKLGPALAAGVSIVFKPAEQTPLSMLLVAEYIKNVGYPAGAFNLVNGFGAITGDALSRHEDVDKVSTANNASPADSSRSPSPAPPPPVAASPSPPPSRTSSR